MSLNNDVSNNPFQRYQPKNMNCKRLDNEFEAIKEFKEASVNNSSN